MRVLMNGVSALKPKTGVGHTTAQLHRALTHIHPTDCIWLYPGDNVAALARRALRGLTRPTLTRTRNEGNNVVPPSQLRRRVGPANFREGVTSLAKAAYRVHFRVAARWGRFDLYHEPNFVPIPTHLPTVVTVHDLSVLLYPAWHPADRVRFHDAHFRRGIAAADHVIVVSESIRREVLAHLAVSPDRVTTVHNGIGEHYHPQTQEAIDATRRKLGLPPRYFLAVGTIEPRKNIQTLLRAYCDMPAELRSACPLVLAGGWGWKSELERDFFESEARHRGAMHLGYVEDADLPAIYSGASALLYPSFYEGFGLPPVEMLACGGRVIASTAAAVREVVGRHAWLLDPHDVEGWRDAMATAIREADARPTHRSDGLAHARQFTWECAARTTFGVYQRVLGRMNHKAVPSAQLSDAINSTSRLTG